MPEQPAGLDRDAPPAAAPRHSPEAPPRRRWLRWLGWGLALPVATLVGASAWLLGTQSGLDAGLALAERATGGALQAEGARGRVLGGFQADTIAWRTTDLALELHQFALAWRPGALLQGRVHIDELSAARVRLAQTVAEDAPEAAPPSAPASLELPVAVELTRLAVGVFAMRDLPAAQHGRDWLKAGPQPRRQGACGPQHTSGNWPPPCRH